MKHFKSFLSLMMFTFFLISCGPTSNKEKIIGKWETVITQNANENRLDNPLQIRLMFSDNQTLKSEMIRDGEVSASYQATYAFENEEKHLIVFREGKKDKRNVAAILKLTGSEMLLVDISGSGDTVLLRKIK